MTTRQKSIRHLAFVGALGLASLAFTPFAAAQNDYSSQGSVSQGSAVAPGATVTISGVARVGQVITVAVDGETIATYIVGSGVQGQQAAPGDVPYSFEVTIPSNLGPGSHSLAVAVDGTVVSTSNFSVPSQASGSGSSAGSSAGASAGADTGGDALAFTGGESAPLALGALGMIAAGGSLLVVRRRNATA